MSVTEFRAKDPAGNSNRLVLCAVFVSPLDHWKLAAGSLVKDRQPVSPHGSPATE